MNSKLISVFRLFLASIVYWVFVFLLLRLLRYGGLDTELSYYLDEPIILPTSAFYESAILLGLATSVIYTLVETLFDLLSQKIALGLVIMLKSIIYFGVIIVLLSLSKTWVENDFDIDLPNEGVWWTTNPNFWNSVIYFTGASLAFQLVRIAIDRFGQGNFWNVFLGRYKRPTEEEHVLMFIDLKDSTTIAEGLGHHNYSEFIQDCFSDLDRVLSRYNAKVYQYVGDEAVVHWTLKKGFRNNNCIRLFFAFNRRLNKRKRYYERKYKTIPKFKAGIHFGKLIVAEVGSLKKELAFHGDVINTAARLQACCNEFKKRLLVSGEVLERLSISDTHFELMAREMELRGKEERIKIYAISNDS